MTSNVTSSNPSALVRFHIKLEHLKLEYTSWKDIKVLQSCSFKCRLNWAHEYRIFETSSLKPVECKNTNTSGALTLQNLTRPSRSLEWIWTDAFEFEYRTQYAQLMHLKLLECTIFRRMWKLWSVAFCTTTVDLHTLATGSQQIRLFLYAVDKTGSMGVSTSMVQSQSNSSKGSTSEQVPFFVLSFTCSMTQYFPDLQLHLNRWTGMIHSDMVRQLLTHVDTVWLLRLCMFNTSQQTYSIHETSNAKPFIKLHHRNRQQMIVVDWQHTRWNITRATTQDLRSSGLILCVYNRSADPLCHFVYTAVLPLRDQICPRGNKSISDLSVALPLQRVSLEEFKQSTLPVHIHGHLLEVRVSIQKQDIESIVVFEQATLLDGINPDSRFRLQAEIDRLLNEKLTSTKSVQALQSTKINQKSIENANSVNKVGKESTASMKASMTDSMPFPSPDIDSFSKLEHYSQLWTQYWSGLASTYSTYASGKNNENLLHESTYLVLDDN
ncbi:MAG: hypothetical protein Sylvanvirus9_20 [Sylvanvirus sp.]|uniref:Uncharacterized protein n=1 Tax=Sylvanvirus sp. TaxID=2487774 RepID=A0A3G5AHY8_9VIRU|nr:MAG: hypothetical protein Sylvanvirus9_20 [Sylvanvirus sp.]